MSTSRALNAVLKRRAERGPKYVKTYEDRHGKKRLYYRRPGYASMPLCGGIGSDEFNASYAAAEARYVGARGRPRQKGFVYFIRVRGFDLVKVGYSAAPSRRLAELEAGSGMLGGLEIIARFPGDADLEQRLHRKFSRQRLYGEWFCLSGAVTEWLSVLAREEAA